MYHLQPKSPKHGTSNNCLPRIAQESQPAHEHMTAIQHNMARRGGCPLLSPCGSLLRRRESRQLPPRPQRRAAEADPRRLHPLPSSRPPAPSPRAHACLPPPSPGTARAAGTIGGHEGAGETRVQSVWQLTSL